VAGHDPERAWRGLNLYTSGHAAEAVLMDMEGRTLHRWRYPLRRLWPDLAGDPAMARLEFWRRAVPLPGGELLAIYEGLGVVKLDAASRVLWAHRGGAHHDLDVDDRGRVWTLSRRGVVLPRIHTSAGVLEDRITVLDAGGRQLREISILECFERSPWAELLRRMPASGDILHTNSLEILDGGWEARMAAFARGNLLVSVLQLDALAVIDPRREAVVWALTGPWRRQHRPTPLASGRLLLFDNVGLGRERSRVIEIDPASGDLLWQYGGPEVDFSSRTLGSSQRLPNGNTLITESESGRAFEITATGEIVWEFNSPHRAGEQGELVASLFEVERLPEGFPWRAAGAGGAQGEGDDGL
jgi:outer membrane protein assembly factor BamB